MTVYGRSDIESVSISGINHAHVREKGETNMKVTCVECEPELLKMGWVTDIRNVELTYDEILDSEQAKEEIARFEQLKVAETAKAAAEAVRSAGRSTTRGTKQVRRGTSI